MDIPLVNAGAKMEPVFVIREAQRNFRNVNLVVIQVLQIGVLFIVVVMAIVVQMVP